MDTIKETKELYEEYKNQFKDDQVVVESIQLHQNTGLPFIENIFRIHSRNYYKSINEARKLWKEGKLKNVHEWDEELFKTNAGEMAIYEGQEVPLDVPMINEAEYQGRKVKLNKPMKGGSNKPYKVYVKNKSGNVVKVEFGSGMRAKISDPEAKKAFKDRHNCEQKKDNTKPGYWSCRLPRYAKSLGLSGSGQWW